MYKDKEKEKATRKRWNDSHPGYRKKYGSYKLNQEQRLKKVIREKKLGHYQANMNFNTCLKPKLKKLNLGLGCQLCGELKTEFHHTKYTINYWYVGYHLCQLHHQQAHKDASILDNIEIKDYNYLVDRPKCFEVDR